MAWTDPRTWADDELITDTIMNAHVRDNLNYLLSPNHQRIIRNNSGTYSITSITTFEDIDSTNLSISLTTNGGPVWVNLLGKANIGVSEEVYFDLAVDGTRIGASYTLGLTGFVIGAVGAVVEVPLNMSLLLTGLAAATYILRPQWRTQSGDTVALPSDTATNPVIFEAIEL